MLSLEGLRSAMPSACLLFFVLLRPVVATVLNNKYGRVLVDGGGRRRGCKLKTNTPLRKMPTISLTILLASTIVLRVVSEFSGPIPSNDYSTVYTFLGKWASASKTRMLTVVFDDYDPEARYDVPNGIFDVFNVSTRLVTLKQLVSLKGMHPNRDYQAIETGGCVLLVYSDVDHLRDILASPHLASFWQPEDFYILQDSGRRSVDSFNGQRFCKWAFERLWRFRRVYKLVLLAGGNAIRYDPFGHASDHTSHINASCDSSCIKSSQDSFLTVDRPNAIDIADFFEEEQRRSFDRYPLRISIFKTSMMRQHGSNYDGIDFKYLEEVSRMMNVTPVFLRSKDKYGWEEKGVFFGTVGHLVYAFADVSFNQFFVKDYLTRQIEFTAAITSDKLCVLVPKAAPVPDYLVIVKIFSGGAWFLIIAGHFVIAMIYTTLKEVLGREEKRWFLQDTCGNEGELVCRGHQDGRCPFAGQSSAAVGIVPPVAEKQRDDSHGDLPLKPTRNIKGRRPKGLKRLVLSYLASLSKYLTEVVLQLMQPFERSHPWFPERLLLMCSLCLSLILNGVFTSQLASSFSKRMYYDDIDTLEQLEESGLPILTNSRDIIEDALTDSTSPVIKRLHTRMEYANDSEINRRLFEAKDAGFLHRLNILPLKYDENQIQHLHVVRECPKDYILANIMTKGSPFRGRINNILDRLNNGGFYDKWYQNMSQLQKRKHRGNQSTTHRKITMEHLFIPFAILYVGLAASTVVLIYECKQNNTQ